MKANHTDRNENQPSQGISVETSARNIEEIRDDEEITIRIERIEDIIATAPSGSHHRERGSGSK